MAEEETFELVVDLESKRPGCVLLQAAFGCGENNFLLHHVFDPTDWLLAPVPGLVRVPGTLAQWQKLAGQLREARDKVRSEVASSETP
jgi:hypothetical protein